jgi:RNA polymerase sigma-70 factor (ECF subfamily)
MPDDESNPSDQFLVRRALAGVDSSFALLFHRYYDPVRSFAYRIVLDYQASDDVAQETFIRAATKLSTLREGQSFAGWLFRIASNVSKDHLRARKSHQNKLLEAGWQTESVSCDEWSENPDAVRVAKALANLPIKQREAVALVLFENHTHAEAAERLGCAESTISWRMALAKRTLRKRLSQ